jgi:hypothetical protein
MDTVSTEPGRFHNEGDKQSVLEFHPDSPCGYAIDADRIRDRATAQCL